MSSRHETDRRDFLKVAGFSLTALALPSCSRAPEHEAVPFLDKPEEITPGISTWYATTARGCPTGCGVLAKYRDGRPIKLEPSEKHPVTGGGTCAACQASILSLYDSKRLRSPQISAEPVTWQASDDAIGTALRKIKDEGGAVRVLTSSVNGPTEGRALKAFLAGFPDARHVSYDPVSASALLDAHERTLGQRVLPRMRFDLAEVVVSFDADFLGTWISPVEFTRDYQAARRLDPEREPAFSLHVQLESHLSLTGCNADQRHALSPEHGLDALTGLAERVASRAGQKTPWPARGASAGVGLSADVLDRLADALWASPRGRSLVVCGVNRLPEQTMTAYLNHLLGNYGDGTKPTTLDLGGPAGHRLGDDKALTELLGEIEAGQVAALIVVDCNPVYDLPQGAKLATWLRDERRVPLSISTAGLLDKTAAACRHLCPDHHALEKWDDAEPHAGVISTSQPVILPLGDTRPWIESLASWSGKPVDAREQMRAAWHADVFPRHLDGHTFERFWSKSIHDGYAQVSPAEIPGPSAFRSKAVAQAAKRPAAAADALALVLYTKIGVGDGRGAHNPWLQELPDPVSKISWDNCALLAPEKAAKLGLKTGDVVALEIPDATPKLPALELPVLVQPGQPADVVAVALGYGRAGTDRFADIGPKWIEGRPTVEPGHLVGVNAAPFVGLDGPYRTLSGPTVTIRRTGGQHDLATSQLHHSLTAPAELSGPNTSPRPIAETVSLDAWQADPAAGAHKQHPKAPLWNPDHPYEGHHWDLAVDLSRCTGCAACVIACQSENNIPVVGKDEMRRQRDMHWIRIDRYFDSEDADATAVHQPMLCQQCDNAPCETVCPVLATVHSSEGLNQQTYNRCVGTRYCSNNCPYKVRRFNWFTYPREDKVQNMALNPDVTVRSRGVMEKCTFCVQRLQAGKQLAAQEGRPLTDADVQPACMQVCPAGAMTFGDRNDPESGVTGSMNDKRTYRVLEDLGVDPSVHYLRRVRNREKGHGHG